MTCEETRERLAVREGGPDVAAHLAGCAECARREAGYRRVWDLAGLAPEPEPPAAAVRAVRAGIARRRRAAGLAGAAAAAAVVVFGLWVSGSFRTAPGPQLMAGPEGLQRTVTVEARDESLGEVLDRLGRAGGVAFRAEPASLTDRRVTLEADGASIAEVLRGMGLSWRVEGGTVVVGAAE